jgi:hypothetical protein
VAGASLLRRFCNATLPAANARVTVFENGEIRRRWTFDEVRARAEAVLLPSRASCSSTR